MVEKRLVCFKKGGSKKGAGVEEDKKIQMLEYSLLKCFGQHTNSTPENKDMPHGNNMAKLRICMPRSWQAAAPVWFHLTNGQQREALCMWSNRQPSGTNKASDWNGPSIKTNKITTLPKNNKNKDTLHL